MRVFSILLCCAMLLPLCGSSQNRRAGAHIAFEQTEINFGTVSRKGEDKRFVFSFTNDGSEPLVLFAATTSCSCVKANFSRKPIPAGGKGEIELLIEVKKMDKGLFHRVVQIRSNSVGGTEHLTLGGVVKD